MADSSIGKRANCRCSVGRARAFLMGLVVSERKLSSWFGRFTAGLARFIGRPAMLFFCALLAVGSIAAYASHDGLLIDGTNLAINVLTLLFLPILQATQNRDGAALQAKLDELIKSNKEARNDLIGIEDLPEEQIEELRAVPDTVTDPRPAEPVA